MLQLLLETTHLIRQVKVDKSIFHALLPIGSQCCNDNQWSNALKCKCMESQLT